MEKAVDKLDTMDPNADWVQQDDVLYPDGVSRTGFVIVGEKFCICGAYVGRTYSKLAYRDGCDEITANVVLILNSSQSWTKFWCVVVELEERGSLVCVGTCFSHLLYSWILHLQG